MDDDGDTSYLGANEMPVGSPNCLGSSVVYLDLLCPDSEPDPFCTCLWPKQIYSE
jgi:hypothetical protein